MSGTPSVEKYPSLTALAHTTASCSDFGVNPSTLSDSFHDEWPTGEVHDVAAPRTPGSARISSTMRCHSGICCSRGSLTPRMLVLITRV